MEQDLRIMVSIRNQMQRIPPKDHTPEYAAIYQSVQSYIRNHCNHRIIEDMVDIHPECSQTIYYCEYCESTFDYNAYAKTKNKE
jgi:hypothetical protein